MSLLPILTWPDPRLSEACAPCSDLTDARALANDMLDTMYAAPGRGLAAPQVGRMVRLFVMDTTWKEGRPDPMVFVNPSIQDASVTKQTNEEGCLSIPGITTSVTRPADISVTWLSLEGTDQSGQFSGFAAACIQHEMDHLDGRVTLDHLTSEQRLDALRRYETHA